MRRSVRAPLLSIAAAAEKTRLEASAATLDRNPITATEGGLLQSM